MNYYELILAVLCLVYCGFLWWCLAGWMRIPETVPDATGATVSFTVIIPARNEEEHIMGCLESIYAQEYDREKCEVIVVDDDSSDLTAQRVQEFITLHSDFSCRLVALKVSQDEYTPFKKRAIEKAVGIAGGDWIVTTDADCILPPRWLKTIACCREKYDPVFISAPVVLAGEKNILEKMQSLEFLGLVGIGAASIQHGHPILCNGANMAYEKKAFLKAGGYGTAATASGDDTQLLRSLSRQEAGRISFLKSREACVTTTGLSLLPDLLQQRIRWSSKIPSHMGKTTAIVAADAFLLHAGIIAGLFSASPVWLAAWILKALSEFIFLYSLTGFFKKRSLLWYFPLAQLVYPLYITVTGILALKGSYRWKGRKQTVRV